MIQKVFDPEKLNDRLLQQAIRRRRPLSATLELTYRCNFRCRMCYVRMSDDEAAAFGRMRTPEEWLDMARQLYDAGVLNLLLTGGECTRYPGFEALYPELYRMGFRISIMTNAGAYTDSIRALFTRYPPRHAAVTLYGGSSETYALVTGDPGGFQRTVENIRFFRSIRVPVGLNFTMIRENVGDYEAVGRLCQSLGLPFTLITDITAHRYDPAFSHAAQCRLSPAERACIACHPPEEAELAMRNAEELEKELASFTPPAAPRELPPPQREYCVGGLSGCCITWNGDMQVCVSMSGYRPVKPFETGFEAAWQELLTRREELFLVPPACQVCEMRAECDQNCPGRRADGTGSPGGIDTSVCQYVYLLRQYKERKV